MNAVVVSGDIYRLQVSQSDKNTIMFTMLINNIGFFRGLDFIDIYCLVGSFILINLISYLRSKFTDSYYSVWQDLLFRLSVVELIIATIFVSSLLPSTGHIVLFSFFGSTFVAGVIYVFLGIYFRPTSEEEETKDKIEFDLNEIDSIHNGIRGSQPSTLFNPRELGSEIQEPKIINKEE